MKFMKVLFAVLFSLAGQMALAEPVMVCARDHRPADGNYTQVLVQRNQDGLYDVYQSYAQGGLSPFPKPEPIINQLVASGLTCEFNLSEEVLALCTQADGADVLRIQALNKPYLEVLVKGTIIAYVEESDCSITL